MPTTSTGVDAFKKPPESLRAEFKKWQKQSSKSAPGLTDFTRPETQASPGWVRTTLDASALVQAFGDFCRRCICSYKDTASTGVNVFESTILPGLFVYPSLLPQPVQIALLDRLLHRDLSNPVHQTNLHLHYDFEYPSLSSGRSDAPTSFFADDPGRKLQPRDPSVHKPIAVQQVLDKKLRWVTLGGQYNWTTKLYPSERPPDFPADIAGLLSDLFPQIDSQAAILNFYSPGDTLSLHRDVSEECAAGLVSISIGCDGIFIVGSETGDRSVTLRLRSGDAVLMSGESRFAWHAVPKVISSTCPEPLEDWPCLSSQTQFAHWKGWLKNKRINLNVRQMRARPLT